MAEHFKMMLEDNPTSFDPHQRDTVLPDLQPFQRDMASDEPYSSQERANPQGPSDPYTQTKSLLAEAFRREYSGSEKRKRSMSHGGGGDQEAEWHGQAHHLLLGDKPQHPYKTLQDFKPSPEYLVSLKRRRSPSAPSQPLVLPGLGAGRQRNEYGKRV